MQSQGTAPLLRWGIAGAGAIARRFCQRRQSGTPGAGAWWRSPPGIRGGRDEPSPDDQGLAPRSMAAISPWRQSPEVDAVYVAVIHPEHAALIEADAAGGQARAGGETGGDPGGGVGSPWCALAA